MRRKKKLAQVKRKREAEQREAQAALDAKRAAAERQERLKQQRELKEWRRREWQRQLQEQDKYHMPEPNKDWADGKCTKKRSVLNNY